MFKIPIPILIASLQDMAQHRLEDNYEVVSDHGDVISELIYNELSESDVRDIISAFYFIALHGMDCLMQNHIENLPDDDPHKKEVFKELAMLNLVMPCGDDE